VCPVNAALLALQNNMTTPGTYDLSVVAAMRGIFTGNKVYKFRASRVGTIISGAGFLAVTLSCDLYRYNEGSALGLLFDECKLNESRFELMTRDCVAASLTPFWYQVGFDPIVSPLTPTEALIARLPGSMLCSTFSSTGRALVFTASLPARPFGLVSDEAVVTPRIASGCNATWNIVNNSGIAPTSSSTYFSYRQLASISLRSRG